MVTVWPKAPQDLSLEFTWFFNDSFRLLTAPHPVKARTEPVHFLHHRVGGDTGEGVAAGYAVGPMPDRRNLDLVIILGQAECMFDHATVETRPDDLVG